MEFTFIETHLFTRLVQEYLSDEHYAELQFALVSNPELGPVIAGTGGVRKLRWAAPGRGKRGGYRVIYYVRRQGRHMDVDDVPKERDGFNSRPGAETDS